MNKITIDNGETKFELECDKVEFVTSAPLEALASAPCRFQISGNLHAVSPMPEPTVPPEQVPTQVIDLTPSQS